MKPGAALANALWLAGGAASALRYSRALRDPEAAQGAWLRAQLRRHSTSEFGKAHDFAAICSAAEYAHKVPLADYSAFAPAIERTRLGARDVLSCDRVVRIAPTSGTSGARKLIPFTATLSRGFSVAVAAWMHDLRRQRPGLVGGPAYWSVSPLADADAVAEGGMDVGTGERSDAGANGGVRAAAPTAAIPVGFADDAEYLGGAAAALVRQALAAPDSLRHVRDVATFWALTLLALLRQRALRLISVWHPSFLDLLVESAEASWPLLLEAIASGECPWQGALPPAAWRAFHTRGHPARADELRRIGPRDWVRWWPQLQVVSCWGDQAASGGWRRLQRALPGVLVQPKGLLATEGVVTIPYGDARPLALTSHFFEFLGAQGDVYLAHQLQHGATYEVVLTNGGGLWRYRLGDMVECTRHVHGTPSLRFVGRNGLVSDLRGEKLSEPFVAERLRRLWGNATEPTYCAMRARDDGSIAGYELLVSPDAPCDVTAELAERLERALQDNPHYALARRLGQLQPIRVVEVSASRGREELHAHGGRLGDVKPRLLIAAVRD